MLKIFPVLLLLFSMLGLEAQTRFEYHHQQMGTQIRLVFYTSNQVKADSVATNVMARIDELNGILSDYDPNSELNALCNRTQQDVLVSDDLNQVLRTSVQISEQTQGTFDVTAGPFVRLWRKARKTKTLPSSEEIYQAKKEVGFKHISFLSYNKVRLEKPNMKLDLGGVGKGFTADEALKLLQLNGINSALIDMGGDIRVGNPPPNKEHWVLAFSYYDIEGTQIIQKVKLKNQAIATSGDLYQFVIIDGIRYSHIIDPKTGKALTTGIQATVIAPNATLADGYASAYSVLGIDKMKEKALKKDNVEIFMTAGFAKESKRWVSEIFRDYLLD